MTHATEALARAQGYYAGLTQDPVTRELAKSRAKDEIEALTTVVSQEAAAPEVTDAALAVAGKALAIEIHGDGADQQDADYYARVLRPALEAAYRVTTTPQRDERGRTVIHLTPKEYGALSEAVRYSQQAHAESALIEGRLNPTLSRIQRKLGEEPSA